MKNGGGGLGQAVAVFAPMLLKAGMPEATLKIDPASTTRGSS